MPMTKDNVLLVTLKKNQHAPSLQLLPKSSVVSAGLSRLFWLHKPMWRSAWSASWPPRKVPWEFMKTTREALFMQKIVLVCRLYVDCLVQVQWLRSISRRSTTLGGPTQSYSVPHRLRQRVTGATLVLCTREIRRFLWLAVNHRVLIGPLTMHCLTHIVCISIRPPCRVFTFSDKKVQLQCLEVRMYLLTSGS